MTQHRFYFGMGATFSCFISTVMVASMKNGVPVGLFLEGSGWVIFTLCYYLVHQRSKVEPPRDRYYILAEEFTPFPEGRFTYDGSRSGETFRQILIPKLQAGPLALNLDGTMGFSSSWLEGCFWDLKSFAPVDRLKIICSDDSITKEVWHYINAIEDERAWRKRNQEMDRILPERK